MADEYIKREDAEKALIDQCYCTGYGGLTKIDIQYVMEKIPSVDVAPVVHGEWLEKGTIHDENADVIDEWQTALCSVCNKYHTTPYSYYFTDYNFCPNCGARMDGGT